MLEKWKYVYICCMHVVIAVQFIIALFEKFYIVHCSLIMAWGQAVLYRHIVHIYIPYPFSGMFSLCLLNSIVFVYLCVDFHIYVCFIDCPLYKC